MGTTFDRRLADFVGAVIAPGAEEYESASHTALGTGTPALIVRPVDTDDVGRAVRYAEASGLPLAVRGGGHSAAGLSTIDGGIVIDLRALDAVVLSEDNRVRVGGGATWRQVVDALSPHGLVISSGDTADVGVGGLTLSGGIGWMVRQYGLTLDHLRAVEIVLASGEVLVVDMEHHGELFWALRGGGGAYGIVTAFEFEAQPVASVAFGTLTFPAQEAEQVVRGWVAHMRAAPHAISSTLTLANALAGGREAPVEIALVRSDDGDGLADCITALCELGTPLSTEERRVPYAEILNSGADLPVGLRASVRSGFVGTERADAAAQLIARVSQEEQPATIILHSLGGAFSNVPADSTAFAHRHAELMVTTFAVGTHAATGAIRTRLDEAWTDLSPLIDGSYANSLDGSAADAVAAVYPAATLRRLSAVKHAYDPRNLFAHNFAAHAAFGR